MKHLDWIQVARATSELLSHGGGGHIDELISVEKSLLQGLDDPSGIEALSQILEMLKRRENDKWYVTDACML